MNDPRREEPLIGMVFFCFINCICDQAFEFVTKWLSFEIKGGILVTVSFSVNVFNNLPISYFLNFSLSH